MRTLFIASSIVIASAFLTACEEEPATVFGPDSGAPRDAGADAGDAGRTDGGTSMDGGATDGGIDAGRDASSNGEDGGGEEPDGG